MSHTISIEQGRRFQLLDAAGNLLRWVGAAEAQELMDSGKVEILGTRRKIRALRYPSTLPDANLIQFPLRKPGMGSCHRRETDTNPRGTRTIERIPTSARPIFTTVLDECIVEDESQAA